jgi:separase
MNKSTNAQGTDALSTNLQALSLTKENSDNTDALNRPALWSLVPALHQGYMQTANIYRHLGMIRESMYYVNEALKALQAVGAKPIIDWTSVWLGDLKIRCGEIEEGETILDAVEESMSATRAMIAFHVAKGNLEKMQGDFESEVGAYRAAERMIDELLAKAMDKSTAGGEVQQEVVSQ